MQLGDEVFFQVPTLLGERELTGTVLWARGGKVRVRSASGLHLEVPVHRARLVITDRRPSTGGVAPA